MTIEINETTPAQIEALGNSIASAAEQLEQIFRQLSAQADSQLVEAARAFIAEHESNPNPNLASYNQAHEALLKAAIAASNIKERGKRSTTLRSRCAPWEGESGRQDQSDLALVIEKATRKGN